MRKQKYGPILLQNSYFNKKEAYTFIFLCKFKNHVCFPLEK